MDRRELIKLMKDATVKLCDDAIGKWVSGQYHMPTKDTQENIQRWQNTKTEAQNFASELLEMEKAKCL